MPKIAVVSLSAHIGCAVVCLMVGDYEKRPSLFSPHLWNWLATENVDCV